MGKADELGRGWWSTTALAQTERKVKRGRETHHAAARESEREADMSGCCQEERSGETKR